jgi:hypothetical protein
MYGRTPMGLRLCVLSWLVVAVRYALAQRVARYGRTPPCVRLSGLSWLVVAAREVGSWSGPVLVEAQMTRCQCPVPERRTLAWYRR